MIVSAILNLLAAIVSGVVGVLPTGALGLDTSMPAVLSDTGGDLAGYGVVSFLNTFLPIDEMLTALEIVITVVLPAVVAYKTVNWLYRHIPGIGGG